MRAVSLFWRVFAINAAVLVAAVAVLALSPATVSSRIEGGEVAVLGVGVALVLAVNLLALRRVFRPLEQLTALMRRVDPLAPGRRIVVERQAAEVAELSHAFNDMLDRLERERRDSGRRALDAQEEERRRMARELHDEIGQTLTGVVLQLETLERRAPEELRADLRSLEATTRAGIEEVRELVRRLRPEALDDFGLRSALVSLGSDLAEHSGLRVSPTSTATSPRSARRTSSSSTASPRRASSTSCATRAPAAPSSACGRRTARSCCACATTAVASTATDCARAPGCAACASARCSSAASSRSAPWRRTAPRSP